MRVKWLPFDDGSRVGKSGPWDGGLVVFLLIDPLIVWIWIDDPPFVEGAIDSPDVVVAIVSIGMGLLGFWGMLIDFAKTRVTSDSIEWGTFRWHRLPLSEIGLVENVSNFLSVTVLDLRGNDVDRSRRGWRAGLWHPQRRGQPT